MGAKGLVALVGLSLAGAAALWWTFGHSSSPAPRDSSSSERAHDARDFDAARASRSEPSTESRADVFARGLVVDEAGAPVASAEIWAYGEKLAYASGRRIATSSHDGSFEISRAPDLAWIGALAAGHAPSEFHRLSEEVAASPLRLELLGLGGEIEGRVADSDGTPVARATIVIGLGAGNEKRLDHGAWVSSPPEFSLDSNADGRFVARGVAPGTIALGARAAGMAPWRGSVDVRTSTSTHVDIALVRGAELRGTITTANGAPALGVKVDAFFRDAFDEHSMRTGDDGSFRLVDLAPGVVSARAEARGGIVARKNFEASPGDVLRWDPVLAHDPEIVGRVLDSTRTPLEGWIVRATRTGDAPSDVQRFIPEVGIAKTDAEGRFVIRHCQNAIHRLAVDPPANGWEVPTTAVEGVRPDSTEVVVIVSGGPRPTATIVGRVLDPSGKPVADADVHVERVDSRATHFLLHTEENTGRFEVGPLLPGMYQLIVQALRYPPIRLAAHRLDADERLDLGDLRLQESGFVVVSIDDRRPAGREAAAAHATDVSERLATFGYVTVDGELVGRPAPSIRVLGKDGEDLGTANLVDNEARSSPLAPGSYVLSVGGVRAALVGRPFDVVAGEETRLEVEIRPGVKREFQFRLSPSDSPDVRFHWILRDDAGALLDSQVRSGAVDGRYVETLWLAPGRYAIEATTESGTSTTGRFAVGAVAEEAIAIELKCGPVNK